MISVSTVLDSCASMANTEFDPSSTHFLAQDLEHGATRVNHVSKDNAITAGYCHLAVCFVAGIS